MHAFLIAPEYFTNADGSNVLAAPASTPADSERDDEQVLDELLEGLRDG